MIDKANHYFAWFKANYPDSLKKDKCVIRNTLAEMQEQIKKCLNEGITNPDDIAFKTHHKKVVIKEQLKYVLENSPKRKIPDYKNGTVKEIYV